MRENGFWYIMKPSKSLAIPILLMNTRNKNMHPYYKMTFD